jgi:hypothetical protein
MMIGASGPIFAANSWSASAIQDVLVQDNGTTNATGLVQVTMPTSMTYVPSCHTASLNIFYIDLSRAPSEAQYAMLLSAFATGQSVTIALNESCIGGVALLRNVDISH